MLIASLLRIRTIAAIAAALIVASAAYGFAASNTVDSSSAGDGTANISGYTISDQTYELKEDPSGVNKVTFTVTPLNSNPAPTMVKVQFNGAGTWYDADHTTGTTWEVDLSSASITVSSLSSMRVIAGELTEAPE